MMMTFAGGIMGFLWSLMMIVGMTLPVLLVIWLLVAAGEQGIEKKKEEPTPLETLKIRLVQGEISFDDFQRLKGQISSGV
ncbi:hypothetical protein [Desulforamulus aeronauticus]|uniref:Putative membrane protein n=1 Tax=Desulforamulus aeronauticus DSM 10349 TaxID=1121421 RepID=A0A1M6X5V5_9FIRM|nr:hypothetical protein [Desulforamulus aeronauticus]SHL01175.1 putative membrane protein [Desulforamulus aeronauticus DSM 10349]